MRKGRNSDNRNSIGYAKQRPTVLAGAVCDYLDSFTLPVGGGRVVRRCWVNFQCRGVLQF